jgi:hypothetical protein
MNASPNRLAGSLMAFCLVGAVAGCSPPQAAPSSGGAKFNVDLPLGELMGHVVDPAAWSYWRGSGTEETLEGTKDLSPTTEEGWVQLENSAAILIESGNLLQLQGRARDPQGEWYKYAQELTTRSIAAKAAAEKHDKAAVYEEGAKLFTVCEGCHKVFVIEPGLKANGRPEGTLPPWPTDFPKKK